MKSKKSAIEQSAMKNRKIDFDGVKADVHEGFQIQETTLEYTSPIEEIHKILKASDDFIFIGIKDGIHKRILMSDIEDERLIKIHQEIISDLTKEAKP